MADGSGYGWLLPVCPAGSVAGLLLRVSIRDVPCWVPSQANADALAGGGSPIVSMLQTKLLGRWDLSSALGTVDRRRNVARAVE